MATSHILVCLPDGSMRLFDEPLLIARDVLREYPHHDLFLSPSSSGGDRDPVVCDRDRDRDFDDGEWVCDDDDARSTASSATSDSHSGSIITGYKNTGVKKPGAMSAARRFHPVNPHRCLTPGAMYYLMPRREYAWKCQLQAAEAAEAAAERTTTKTHRKENDNLLKKDHHDQRRHHHSSNGCRHLAARETSPPAPSSTSSNNPSSSFPRAATASPRLTASSPLVTPVNTEPPSGRTHPTTTIIGSNTTTSTSGRSSGTSSSSSSGIQERASSRGEMSLHEPAMSHPEMKAFPREMHFVNDGAGRSFDVAAAGTTGTERREDESQLMLMLLVKQQSMLQELLEARRSAGEGGCEIGACAAAGAEDGGKAQDLRQHELAWPGYG
ncbi:unnamed protein product [Closterium sp. Yama58-4]|nr:unnamed protein product [Closterium sp. Yama58-4]